jgi:integrase
VTGRCSVTGRKKKRSKAEQKRKLRIGVDIPLPTEIKAMVDATSGRWRMFLMFAVSTGLRSSELRAVAWDDIDMHKSEVRVQHRADRIDVPKSEAGERVIPLLPRVVKALREWRLECPKGPLGLVFLPLAAASTAIGGYSRRDSMTLNLQPVSASSSKMLRVRS